LAIAVKDEKSGAPLAARMELRDARGRPVRNRPKGAVAVGDSIYLPGELTLELRRGDYAFLIEAGPEYHTRRGQFTIDRNSEGAQEITLRRIVDMRGEGWWAGDLDVEAPLSDLPLMMKARGIDLAPAATIVNVGGRCRKVQQRKRPAEAPGDASLFFGPWAAVDRRRGGGLLLLAVDDAPLPDVCRWKNDDPALPLLDAAERSGACVTAVSPRAWDLPVWIAAGKLDAIQLIDRFTQPDAAARDDGERPYDTSRYPGKAGVGRASEAIYHHLLNCGLRVPPAAGSGLAAGGSGRIAAAPPLGANRVYVQCGETCSRQSWFSGLRDGQVLVTNGPLLRTRVEGHPPGHVFDLATGDRHEFHIALDLAFYEQTNVEYLEIVKDGKAVHQIRLDELAGNAGRLPPVAFDRSGWFLVRAVTENTDLYQYATTGPYYVQVGDQRCISRASVHFFLNWLEEAADHFATNSDARQAIDNARPFWADLDRRATGE